MIAYILQQYITAIYGLAPDKVHITEYIQSGKLYFSIDLEHNQFAQRVNDDTINISWTYDQYKVKVSISVIPAKDVAGIARLLAIAGQIAESGLLEFLSVNNGALYRDYNLTDDFLWMAYRRIDSIFMSHLLRGGDIVFNGRKWEIVADDPEARIRYFIYDKE